MTNWPDILANDLATEFEGVQVYSNVDPSREWTGTPTIEFNVNAVDRVPLISGGAFVDYQIVAACRAKTFDEADDLAERLAAAVDEKIPEYIDAGTLYDGVVTGTEIAPDVRGLIEGESFYGVASVTFTEKEQ